MKKNYYAIDIAKFVSALLVVCAHTYPLISVDETANFVLVSLITRLAVPFFFVASAFFFFNKIDVTKGYRDKDNVVVLKNYIWRLCKLYAVWTLIYLPFLIILNLQDGFTFFTVLRIIRDFFFAGSYYHLWFLPALIFSITCAYFIILKFGLKKMMIFSVIMYVIGMAGNIYPTMLEQNSMLASVFHTYENIFVTTRNGLFFGMIFMAMGYFLSQYSILFENRQLYIFISVSILLYIAEFVLLYMNNMLTYVSSMYIMLIPSIFFIFIWLLRINVPEKKPYLFLRKASLLIYVSHILFAQLCMWLLPGLHSLLLYIITVECALILAYIIYYSSSKIPWLKQLY